MDGAWRMVLSYKIAVIPVSWATLSTSIHATAESGSGVGPCRGYQGVQLCQKNAIQQAAE
jgi:hypothetical protein